MKSITKITGFSLIGKKKMLTSAKIDNVQNFFFHNLDDNKLLYKRAKFQVNSLCGLDDTFNATSEPPCTTGLKMKSYQTCFIWIINNSQKSRLLNYYLHRSEVKCSECPMSLLFLRRSMLINFFRSSHQRRSIKKVFLKIS